jgi:3-(3-hydroxy-phenyl)propionate hydroxylase
MLAKRHAFARRLVNSGRLSVPAILADSPLNTSDTDSFAGRMAPGSPALDAPVTGDGGQWLLDYLCNGFTLVIFTEAVAAEGLLRDLTALGADRIGCSSVLVSAACGTLPAGIRRVADTLRMLSERYDAREGTTYLFRPDQHVCARWRAFDLVQVRAAIARATGQYLH